MEEDPRRYSEEVLDLGLSVDEVSPFLLGQRLGEVVDEPEAATLRILLDKLTIDEGADVLQARMLRSAPPSWSRDPGELLLRLHAFRLGFGSSIRF